MRTTYFSPPRPRLFAHRGSSAIYPENTLPAFTHAVSSGIAYLELDVWASRDGEVVVHHDETLHRTCGVDRPVNSLLLEELRCLDAGHNFTLNQGATFPFRGQGIQIPTLAEILEAFPDTYINVEIKQSEPPMEAQVIETVQRSNAQRRVLIASGKDEVLARLRPLCPDIPTNLGLAEISEFFHRLGSGNLQGYEPPGQALQIPLRWKGQDLISEESLAAAHQLGLEVHVWTVNSPEDMARLLGLGIDGLMSDHSSLLIDMTRNSRQRS